MSRALLTIVALMTYFSFSPARGGSLPTSLLGHSVVSGKSVEFNILSAKVASVVAFLSARCPCSASHEKSLHALFDEYHDKGIQFIGIHSNVDEDLESSRSHFEKVSLPFPILQDEGTKYADFFKALKTPHVFVLNSSGKILYQGGVDDSHAVETAQKFFLKEALADISQGKAPRQKETRTLGCVIARAK